MGDSFPLERLPDVHITPQQQAEIVSRHQAQFPAAPVTRNMVLGVVRDLFNKITLNGWPMSFDGGNINVATSAITSTTSQPSQSSVVQAPVVPAFRVTIAPTQVSVSTTPEVTKPKAPTTILPIVSIPPSKIPLEIISSEDLPKPSTSVPFASSTKPLVPALMTGVPLTTTLDHAYNELSAVTKKTYKDPTIGLVDPWHPHSPTMTGETFIPVRLTRADGQRTVLSIVQAATSYVLQGAVDGERTLALPTTDKFYDAGGGGTLPPFGITTVVSSGTSFAIANPYSYLFKAVMDGTVETITGLDTQWSPSIGDYAYLTLTQDNSGNITGIEFTIGEGWAAFPAFYTIDNSDPSNPFVNEFYFPTAKFVDPSSAAPGNTISIGDITSPTPIKVLQAISQNLLQVNRVMGGLVGCAVESYGAVI